MLVRVESHVIRCFPITTFGARNTQHRIASRPRPCGGVVIMSRPLLDPGLRRKEFFLPQTTPATPTDADTPPVVLQQRRPPPPELALLLLQPKLTS